MKGHKTYLIAIIIFALGGVRALGYVDENTYTALVALLAPLGLITLRMGIKK